MASISIKYDGDDITSDCLIAETQFEYLTDGNIGNATVIVKDLRGGTYTPEYFKVGNELTLDVDGVRMWGGYVMKVAQNYPHAAVTNDDPGAEARYWTLLGNDYNILLRRRKLYNKASPATQMKIYKADDEPTDKDIIRDMCNLYLDLDGDGFEAGAGDDVIDLSNVVELGALYWVSECAETWQAASPGMDWADGMRSVCEWSGGVFYIGPADPTQTFKGPVLYYHDVNTATGPYEVNDRPASDPGSKGVREFSHNLDGTELATDALVWGAGMGSQEVVFWRETATTEQNTYGTWQWSDFHQSMYKQECVKHRAKTYIHGSRLNKRGHKKPKESWDIVTFQPDFQIGDVVDVASYIHGVQDTVPIRRMRITFPTHKDAKFELHLSHDYDTAYSTNMWWEQPKQAGPWHEEYISLDRSSGRTTGQAIGWGGRGKMHTYNRNTAGTSKELNNPLDFLGYDNNVGTHYNWANVPWYHTYCGVGVGGWRVDGWGEHSLWIGLTALDAPTENWLYVDSKKFSRTGVGGDITISVVKDYPLTNDGVQITGGGYGSAFWAHSDAGSPPGQPIESMSCLGPLVDLNEPAGWHWWVGYWGSWEVPPPLFIPGAYMALKTDVTGLTNPLNLQQPRTWLVFTPQWGLHAGVDRDGQKYYPVGRIYFGTGDGAPGYCDNRYLGLPGAGLGPREGGYGGSGAADIKPWFDQSVYGTDYWWIKPPKNLYDRSPSIDEYGDGRYYSIAPDAPNGYFYTLYPYVPGTLQVSISGRQLIPGREYWETNPVTGQFRISLGDWPDGMQVRYRISSPIATPNRSLDGYYYIPPDGTGHFMDVPGGMYYRPRFRSQLGWGTSYDAYNCTPASTCHFVDRSTLGAKQPTPPEVRTAMGITAQGTSLQDAADVIRSHYIQYVLNPGILSYAQFVNLVAEGRGAQLTGNSTALVKYNLHARSESTGQPFLGYHSLYVNEVRSDGYLFVYDPAFRVNSRYQITPGWYPPAAIQDYAAYRSGSTGKVWAIYTRKTPRI